MRRHPSKPLLHLLLIALLFATQALVLAHEAGHGLSTDSQSCSVCLHGPQFKSAAPAASAIPPAAAARERLLEPALPRLAATTPAGLRARGPPPSPATT